LATFGHPEVYDIDTAPGRAMLRLMCLGNVNTSEVALIYHEAFNESLDRETRDQLTYALSLDGSPEEPTVQPTYAPAMLSKAYKNAGLGVAEKTAAVVAMLRYLAKVMALTRNELESLPKGVSVVERDLRSIETIVMGQSFRLTPGEALQQAQVPGAQAVNYV
jgi:hypothetical protein